MAVVLWVVRRSPSQVGCFPLTEGQFLSHSANEHRLQLSVSRIANLSVVFFC